MFATRVVFTGSRALRVAHTTLVGQVAIACVEAGTAQFAVGCAAGADAAALVALLAAQQAPFVRVFAVGSQRGEGFPSTYTLPLIRNAQAAGCKVTWLAGGGLEKPLMKRLLSRTAKCVRFIAEHPGGVLCAFFGAGRSSDTEFACKVALSCGLTVVAYTCGGKLPSLPGSGQWVNAPAPFSGGVVWQTHRRKAKRKRYDSDSSGSIPKRQAVRPPQPGSSEGSVSAQAIASPQPH